MNTSDFYWQKERWRSRYLNWQYWVFLTNLEILFNLLPGQILTSFDNECLLMLRHKILDSSCRLRIQGEERNWSLPSPKFRKCPSSSLASCPSRRCCRRRCGESWSRSFIKVGLRLPEGKVVPTRRPRGIYGNYSPDPAWCASGSTNIVPVIRSSQISLAKHLLIPKRNVLNNLAYFPADLQGKSPFS